MKRTVDNVFFRLWTFLRGALRLFFYKRTEAWTVERKHGFLILKELFWKHKIGVMGMLGVNVLAGLAEGGTLAILALAVSALVEDKTSDIPGPLALFVGTLSSVGLEVGRGGIFLLLVVAAIIIQVIKSGLQYTGKAIGIHLRFKVLAELQGRTLGQVMSFDMSEVVKHPAGRLGGLVGQSGQFAGVVTLTNAVLLSIIMLIVYVVALFYLSVSLTVVALFVAGALSFCLGPVVEKLKYLGGIIARQGLERSRITTEYLVSPRLLRVFSMTRDAEREINDVRDEVYTAQKKGTLITASIDPAAEALTVTAAGLFLIVGYLSAVENALVLIPKLFLFFVIMNRMMPQIKTLNQCRIGFASALVNIDLVAEFLRTEGKTFTRLTGKRFAKFDKDIEFRNVSFRYVEGDTEVLSDVSFIIPKGKTVAIVGGSGAGKSTIVNLLAGLYEPTKGEILIDGEPLGGLHLDDWLKSLAIVDQDVTLLNVTVEKNIALTRPITETQVNMATRMASASEFIENLSDGYRTIIGDRGLRLSGGQRQRISIARALFDNPDLVIFDEATSALDSSTENKIRSTLLDLKNEKTVVVIAHRLSTITHADEIIVLDQGKIVENGGFDELVRNEGPFAELWALQSNRPMTEN